ncbi:MAG: hypothetical protein NWF06_03610 [Candidatus Bathyarchaeota archaeon]|nr:hypothetical protein [Candidatus Bathyarchaeum sp.]
MNEAVEADQKLFKNVRLTILDVLEIITTRRLVRDVTDEKSTVPQKRTIINDLINTKYSEQRITG